MKGLYVGCLLLFTSIISNAQFTSVANGNWNDGATWGNASPGVAGVDYPSSSTQDVIIASNVTVAASYSAVVRDVFVGAGYSFTISNTGSLTLNGVLTIEDDGLGGNGLLNIHGALVGNQGSSFVNDSPSFIKITSTGKYTHNFTTSAGSLLRADWLAGSTCEIVGYTSNSAAPAFLNQSFHHFTWNCPNGSTGTSGFISLAGALTTINGNLTVTSTGGASRTLRLFDTSNGKIMTVGGDVILNGNSRLVLSTTGINNDLIVSGDFKVSNTTAARHTFATSGNVDISIVGDFILDAAEGTEVFLSSLANAEVTLEVGGNLTLNPIGPASINMGNNAVSTGIINLSGNFTGNSNITFVTPSDAGGYLNFSGNGVAQTFVNSGTMNKTNYQVNNGSILDMGTSALTGSGTFTLIGGGTLRVGSPDGLVTGTTAGNIRVTGLRKYEEFSYVIYNAELPQNLGNEWGPSGRLHLVAVNLEIANKSEQGVTNNITDVTSLVGVLKLTSGVLNIGNSSTLQIESDFISNGGSIGGLTSSNLVFSSSGTITGTLKFAPTASNLNNFIIDRVETVTLGSSLTIAATGGLEFRSAGNLDISGQSLRVNGDLIQSGSGGLISDASSSLTIGGTGILTSLPFCTTCGDNELDDLTFSRGSGEYTWNNSVTIRGDLTLTTGTLTHSSGLTMGTGSNFVKAGGVFSGPSPSAETSYNVRYTATTSTGSELPTDATGLNNLTISGVVSLSSSITINGAFSVTTGSLTVNSNDITMMGPTWSVGVGGFVPGTRTVTFSRVAGTVISGTPSFHHLTISSGSSISLPVGNTTISGTFKIDGLLNAGSSTVVFSGSATTITGSVTPTFNNINVTGTLAAPSVMNVGGTFTLGGAGSFTAGSTTTVAFTGNNCSIVGNPIFNHITVSGVLHAPPTLTLKGDLAINGTFDAGDIGNVILFNGTVNQKLDRTLGVAATIALNNITTNKSGGIFRIASTVSGTIFRLSGVFTISSDNGPGVDVDFDGSSDNGRLVLASTSGVTARVAPVAPGAQVQGRLYAERYVQNSSGDFVWRNFASPLVGATVADWKASIPVIGRFSDPSNHPSYRDIHEPSIYLYQENVGGGTGGVNDRWVPYPNDMTFTLPASSFTLEHGRGYSVFVLNGAEPTLTVGGTLHVGDKVVNVSFTGSEPDAGYNLIGNPYPSPVDWNQVQRSTSVSPIIALKDNAGNGGLGSGAYIYYDAETAGGGVGNGNFEGILASGQAFFVEANAAGTVTFTEASKSTDPNPVILRQAYASRIRIRIDGNGVADETLIRIRENATEGYDFGMDATKLANDYIDLYSFFKGSSGPLAINTFGQIDCSETINLGLRKAKPGGHSFTFPEIDSFLETHNLLLVDNFAGKSLDLREASTYNFQVTTDTASFGNNRFKLVIMQQPINLDLPVVANDVCEGIPGVINIQSSESNVEYFAAINGKPVSETVYGGGNALSLVIPVAELQSENQVVSIMARRPGCEAVPMAQAVTISVKDILQPRIVNSTGCGAGPVSLLAEGATLENGYRWYEGELDVEPISGATGAELVVPELSKPKTYYVSLVNELGCEGQRIAVEAKVVHNEPAVISLLDDNSLRSNYASGNQWYINGDMIDGATEQTYKPTGPGLYSVEARTGPCSVTAEFLVTALEAEGNSQVRLFPNPTADVITVEVPSGTPAKVSVYDLLGKRLGDVQMTDDGKIQRGTYDMRGNNSGVYLLKVLRGNELSNYKIIKE